MSYYVLVYMFIVSGAKIHLFLPTILYILTIHLYFLTFAHFLFFTLHFLFLFVLYSKDFIVFLQKNKRPINEKKHKDILHLIIYSRIHLFLADASIGIRQHQTERETTLG